MRLDIEKVKRLLLLLWVAAFVVLIGWSGEVAKETKAYVYKHGGDWLYVELEDGIVIEGKI